MGRGVVLTTVLVLAFVGESQVGVRKPAAGRASQEAAMAEKQEKDGASQRRSSQARQWVYGREGMPLSPGIQRARSLPKRGALSPGQERFKDLKFGMFIHWGIESLVTSHPEIARSQAPWSAPSFDAHSLGKELERLGEAFDPAAWVDLAERAGQRYICFTTKHHLGFANFASAHSDYTSASTGPRRDFLRLLADECHRRKMPLFAYISLSDMHHPDFRPLDTAAWRRYAAFLEAQIEELAAKYGPIAGFWLDPGSWNGPSYRYPMAQIEKMVHRRFPGTLVGGRDSDGAEQNFDRRVFLGDEGLVIEYDLFPSGSGPAPGDWPFEVCDTLNRSWFHNPADRDYKDVSTLIRRLVEVVGRGGNYLLNQGPLASGALSPEDVSRLEAVGEWLRRNGEAIYGTRPLGIPAQPWGWPLIKGDKVYLHILRWPGERLTLPAFGGRVVLARWLNGEPLQFEAGANVITLHLPATAPDPVDSIVMLELSPAVAEKGIRLPGIRVTGVPGLVKTGAKYGPYCEATPFVWKGRLLLLVNVRPAAASNPADHDLQVWDVAKNEVLCTFGQGHSLASAFVWRGAAHVYAARLQDGGWHDVSEFKSRDLVKWSEPRVVIKEIPGEQLFNQSVCRADDRFVMAYESNDPRWPAFTIKFAESRDLVNWRLLPDCIFGTDRYTACPCLRYVDGWFYMLYLEHRKPKWWFETFMARSKDLVHWQPSPCNPILAPQEGEDCNTSDPDLAEFSGRVLLYYSYGDQRTWSQLTRAEYPGTLRTFFRACYPG